MKRFVRLLVLLPALLAASGCTALFGLGAESRSGVSSSLVDYLYPRGEVPPDYTEITPVLNLPLRVGLAFVPTYAHNDISEARKNELLQGVRGQFAEYEYIQHIEVIPDTYLRSSRGIDGMQQVARLYGVDVMALVSYDQVSATEDTKASVMYWTIVGAYLIDGTKNETQTFVDTAVFDARTGKLLFRAPGSDITTARTTAIESPSALRRQGEASIANAVANMTTNLKAELGRFEERIKTDARVADVQWREGYQGGGGGMGALNTVWLITLLIAALTGQFGLRRAQQS